MRVIAAQDAERLARNIVIPPRPALLDQLQRLINQPDPDPAQIATLVGQDISLTAAVIKVANSPLYGLEQKVATAPQAMQLLGQKNVLQILSGLMLRAAIGVATRPEQASRLDRFWHDSTQVAMITAMISKTLSGVSAEEAYSFGLFRDCGIPVMMLRFADYLKTLALAEAARCEQFPLIESQFHDCDHVRIGYMVARAWLLPEELAQAILHHHEDQGLFQQTDASLSRVVTLVAVARLADHICHTLQHAIEDSQWQKEDGAPLLSWLGLTPTDYEDLRDAIHQRFHQH